MDPKSSGGVTGFCLARTERCVSWVSIYLAAKLTVNSVLDRISSDNDAIISFGIGCLDFSFQ